jgi:hypothetical protein
MKKLVLLTLFIFVLACSGQAFAGLNDTRADIEKTYGGYRMVVDSDNQLWAREEWEAKGHKKAQAGGYMYYFDRAGMALQMEVNYDGDKNDSKVRAQRITPAGVMKVKELKTYLPEVYALVTDPKAEVFTTPRPVSRNFREDASPLTLGAVVKKPVGGRAGWYTLVAFNLKDEGRLLKEAKYVTPELYIQEITLERIYRIDLEDSESTTGAKYWDYVDKAKSVFKQ